LHPSDASANTEGHRRLEPLRSPLLEQEENDAADLTPVLAASACASSTHSQHQKATGVQSLLMADPSATAHEFSNDLTVNAGEPLSEIHSHPLDLNPMT
jgi:hypothetical protein